MKNLASKRSIYDIIICRVKFLGFNFLKDENFHWTEEFAQIGSNKAFYCKTEY